MPPKGTSKLSPVRKPASNDRPSSPTTLLWAHQLKREHAFLLQKMNNLEDGIKTVERNAKKQGSDHDIAALTKQVQALTEGGDIQRVRKDVMKNIENLQSDLEVVVLQVQELTRQNEHALNARKQQFDAEKTVLQRVKDVEEALAKSVELVKELGERVSEENMDVIKADLAEIVEKVQGEGVEMQRVGESLRALEEITRVLREDNEKVAGEVRELKKSDVGMAAPRNDVQEDLIVTDAGADVAKAKPTKKAPPKRKAKAEAASVNETTDTAASKRPKRGGNLAREVAELQNSQIPQVDRIARKNSAIAKKPVVRQGRGWVEVVESSQEQSAAAISGLTKGGATEVAQRGRGAAKGTETIAPTTEDPPRCGPGRPRKDASQEISNSVNDPTNRPPGRTRKDATQASQPPPKSAPKRRVIKQDDQDDEDETRRPATDVKPIRKRTSHTLLDDFISPPQIKRPARAQTVKLAPAGAKKKTRLRRGQFKPDESPSPQKRQDVNKGPRRGLTNVWDGMSPISSSMSEGETQEAFGPPTKIPVAVPSMALPAGKPLPPPRTRRAIKQDFHDEDLLRRLSNGMA